MLLLLEEESKELKMSTDANFVKRRRLCPVYLCSAPLPCSELWIDIEFQLYSDSAVEEVIFKRFHRAERLAFTKCRAEQLLAINTIAKQILLDSGNPFFRKLLVVLVITASICESSQHNACVFVAPQYSGDLLKLVFILNFNIAGGGSELYV